MTQVNYDGGGDYILINPRLEEMESQYSEGYKFFYLCDEQLWYFKDIQGLEEGFAGLQSGFAGKLDKDEVMLIQDRDEFIALHARAWMEPATMDFKDAIEPFRASKRKAVSRQSNSDKIA